MKTAPGPAWRATAESLWNVVDNFAAARVEQLNRAISDRRQQLRKTAAGQNQRALDRADQRPHHTGRDRAPIYKDAGPSLYKRAGDAMAASGVAGGFGGRGRQTVGQNLHRSDCRPDTDRHYLEIAGIECDSDGDVSAQINLGGWSSPLFCRVNPGVRAPPD